jgi:formylglycine-generating enzyme required for sulfatase activity
MSRIVCGASVGLFSFAVPAAVAQVTFEWATIGHPGNAPDPQDGDSGTPGVQSFGAVEYTFRIAKTEVTNAQYAAFLNAVAASDPHGLYNVDMASPQGGILRMGAAGGYSYVVASGREQYPVINTSFLDAMRFVNWLHNGQGAGGTESGVYQVASGLTETRSVGARFFIPSEHEWYKAAFFQPHSQGGDTDDFWAWSTSSNLAPAPGTDLNVDGAVGGSTPVGSYPPNANGVFDMGGNAFEWNEALVTPTRRGLRGDSWLANSYPNGTYAAFRVSNVPEYEDLEDVGIRVARPAPCPADLSGPGGEPDDVLNSSDFLAFLNLWSTSDPSADLAPSGGNGVWDSSDFLAYLNLYAQGCP